MGFWKGTARYMARRAMYGAARGAMRGAAMQARLEAMQEYGVLPTVNVKVGDACQWMHPQGFYVPATIVGIDEKKQTAVIEVTRNGKPERVEVSSDRLCVRKGKTK